ncbi:hypothetical protein [Thalassobacillus hwangdonensis]|uniref:Uncharacterized protein n=1 Tax=Thalassobacillus hwangdonensis TaxID=546108 RepID=A0ABW3KVX9_9BACI
MNKTMIFAIILVIIFGTLNHYGIGYDYKDDTKEDAVAAVDKITGLKSNVPADIVEDYKFGAKDGTLTRLRGGEDDIKIVQLGGGYRVELKLVGDLQSSVDEAYVTMARQSYELVEEMDDLNFFERAWRININEFPSNYYIQWYMPVKKEGGSVGIEHVLTMSEIVIGGYKSGMYPEWRKGEYNADVDYRDGDFDHAFRVENEGSEILTLNE